MLRAFRWVAFLVAFGVAAGSYAQLPPGIEAAKDRAVEQLKEAAPNARFYGLGAHIERIYGAPLGGGISPEDAFQAFLFQYKDLFGTGSAELRFQGTQDILDGKFTAGYYQEFVGGIPVDNGYLTLLVRNQIGYPIVLASASTHAIQTVLTKPRITSQRAVQNLKRQHPSLKLFTEPTLTIWIDEREPRLAWTFFADNPNLVPQKIERGHGVAHGPLPERVKAFVDAQTGRVLEERNQIYPIDVIGNVKGWASTGLKPDQANNPETLQNLELLRVSISGGNNALTNASGNYSIVNAGSSAVTVNATMQGQWANVVNLAGSNLAMSQVVTPPGPANFIFNPGLAEFDTAQVNGFIQTTRVHNFAKTYSPSFPGIDIAITCNVNQNSTCNAFYSNNTINFYRAGGGCPNTCYSTVVWHEYGHFIIVNGHPAATGDYHEGMADVVANLLGDSPWLGEDFSGQGTGPLRSAYNGVVYPCAGEVHLCGQVISGAFWLTLDELNLTIGHNSGLNLLRQYYFASILLHPTGINPGITVDILTLDDDDANLLNGTPHYTEIAAGFGAKRLFAPELSWLVINPIRIPGEIVLDSPNEILRMFKVQIVDDVGTQDPASIKVNYRLNGGTWQVANMPFYANPTNYLGGFVQPGCGNSVDWYISAKDTAGHNVYYPAGGANNPASFVVAKSLLTITDDTFETDLGWTVVNESLTTGAWVRNNPNGTTLNGQPANPEDDSDDAGTFCWFTGQAAVGGGPGDQDVDGGPTRLISPLLNLAGADANIEYRRWYFNDDGDDAMTVQVSNDNGASWVTVETVMGVQNAWTFKKFRVGQYVTPTATVRVRFNAVDNPNNSVTEAAIDHYTVKKIIC